jgi:hypothetical protein
VHEKKAPRLKQLLIVLVRYGASIGFSLLLIFPVCAQELRGTWLTTTGNDAYSNPEKIETTMHRLRQIGINTVYAEVWKNGQTNYPSGVLQRTLGMVNHNAQSPKKSPDLLEQSLIQAHRQGLIYIAWFEYGFMAAHKDSMTALRMAKPEWLSRDRSGNEVAPNGFVWLNPLHPEARLFLLDLVLELIDQYDVDGIEFDDRLVWPYLNMGYDTYTTHLYAKEHNGMPPPQDQNDAEWMAWRAGKLEEFAKILVQTVRAKKPHLLISLSPAVYPWSWEKYLLDWPKWASWSTPVYPQTAKVGADLVGENRPLWDEFVPQNYRYSLEAFTKTWEEQVTAVRAVAPQRMNALAAGIRLVGEGADSTWTQLRESILLLRRLKNKGHVLWYSRGVLDLYEKELTAFYAQTGSNVAPGFPIDWRTPTSGLEKLESPAASDCQWASKKHLTQGRFRLIGFDGNRWNYLNFNETQVTGTAPLPTTISLPCKYQLVERIIDHRS